MTARSGRQPATAALVLSEGKSSSPSEGPAQGWHPLGTQLGAAWCGVGSGWWSQSPPGHWMGSAKAGGQAAQPLGGWEGVLPMAGVGHEDRMPAWGSVKERSSDQGVELPLGDYDPCK